MSVKKKPALSRVFGEYFAKLRFVREIIEKYNNSSENINIKFLSGSSKSITLGVLKSKLNIPLLIITRDAKSAEEFYHDLRIMLEDEYVSLLSPPKKKSLQLDLIDENLGWMIEGLSKSLNTGSTVTVITPDVLDISIPKPSELEKHNLKIRRGDTMNFLDFTRRLGLNGFERADYVSQPGEMSVRGGILDVFPTGWENPLRFEFWGDDIDSIREFEPISQRSIREHNEVEFIDNLFHSSVNDNNAVIYDFLRDNTLIVFDEPESFEIDNLHSERLSDYRQFTINSIAQKAQIEVNSSSQPTFGASVHNLNFELKRLAALKADINIGADGLVNLNRIRDLVDNTLKDGDEQLSETSVNLASVSETINSVSWFEDSFSSGFEFPEHKIAFFSEHEVFGRRRALDSRKPKSSKGITLRELKQLQMGDYIVHEDKGIGRFDGFQNVKLGGSSQDCLKMIFADGDVLYVHMNYIYKVQKFSAQEGVVPRLSKLGSAEWTRKKDKTKRKLKDIARDLIKLYAERKAQKGYSFPADDFWQKEFEASFIYEDTIDQARATKEVKSDMESASPMDRLVCGDVGFGKTEIALRAAFKAAAAGKQTAVLVPTTILAQQHFMTFKDRIGKYPVSVDVLSRFRTKNEQKEVLEKLKEGKLDILIATHRMLSKDVVYKDLGLLIIDEEHRFGVAAKEKLRQIKVNVDTLTLTATPIPRTLNFSLMGARDLSLMETPPRNRIPIATEVIEWDKASAVDTIEREMQRGGQVYFVSDRIEGLDRIAVDLQTALPSMRFGVAHGQMSASELENIMEKFIQKKYDVLFATKIIESGIDIPNANTIIIFNAHNFGLAELYQLRGRVGRSNVQAYCALMIPSSKVMPDKALKRLQAIEQFTDLGSGLKLAMRDMEIRGAGNLLGAEQSGFYSEIGFELFHKVLDEAVSELKIEEFASIFSAEELPKPKIFNNEDIQIEINSDAFLPDNYVTNDTDRFSYYKQLFNAKDQMELKSICEELEDRFGRMPEQAKELVFAVKLRIAALNTGFQRIIVKEGRMIAEFPQNENNDLFFELVFPHLVEYIHTIEDAKLKETNTKLLLEIPIETRELAAEYLWKIKKTIEEVLINEEEELDI